MLFETLLFACLVHGTSFTDAGKTISLKISPGESALFFGIAKLPDKQCLRIQGENCDCLVYYSKSEKQSKTGKKILCLAELKGGDSEKAVRQILNTYKSLKAYLGHTKQVQKSHIAQCPSCTSHLQHCETCKDMFEDFIWKAFIYQHGSSPNPISPSLIKQLETEFGNKNYAFSKNTDIGTFLRG